MPSPFPGMDPYLEGSYWTTVHFGLCAEIVRNLAHRLSPRYSVLPTERYIMAEPENFAITVADIYPDLGVFETDRGELTLGMATLAAPLEVRTTIPQPEPQYTIEIRDADQHHLVTAIEVLSPINKRGRGREQYLAKRAQLLNSSSHLLEIDFLRQGQRVPAEEPLPEAPYFIFLSRVQKRPWMEVWPIAFDQLLPSVPVPLLPGDDDIPLNLQEVFTSMYDLVRYDRIINYRRPPDVPLFGDGAIWAEERLRAAGLRD